MPIRKAASWPIGCALVLAGCSSTPEPAQIEASSDDFDLELVVDGLVGPTQLFVDDQGWLIAQLNGGEDEGRGQVLAIDPDDLVAPIVVVDDLDKPTGVARIDGAVLVMEADRLRRFVPGGSDFEVVAGPLPNNGRSQGTLTVLGDRVLFNTSGRIDGGLIDGSVVDGGVVDPESGRIRSVAPDGEIEPYAQGFKHAYDRVALADGMLLTTEISDGRLDGEPAADALMVVEPGQDHGWPHCVPDVATTVRRAVAEFDGLLPEGADCDDLPRIITTFDVGATPTSVETVPWDSSLVAVALWGTGEVVLISVESGETVASIAIGRPQDLVADGDRLLVVDHDSGAIYSITP